MNQIKTALPISKNPYLRPMKQYRKSNSPNPIYLPLMLAVAVAMGVWMGYKISDAKSSGQKIAGLDAPDNQRLAEVMGLIEANYVDSVDRHRLLDAAVKGILEELDPHSSFIPSDELSRVNQELEGHLVGIGIRYYILRDSVMVTSLVPDGPAMQAGLKVGDRIITVGDSVLSSGGVGDKRVAKLIRGELNSKVTLGVKRKGNSDLLKIDVTRKEIPIKSVDTYYPLTQQTGYIRIDRFASNTYKEFMEALEDLHDNHKSRNLVVDLRGNGGGYLNAATDIVNQLFEGKHLMVYTEGRTNRRRDYNSQGKSFYKLKNIAVLVDEGSASASEIFAGSIQDNDRGVVIGRRTYGKGLVQEQYDLSDGSALRLTVSKYYTPSGRCIQRPYNGGNEQYEDDFENRIHTGELVSFDSVKLNGLPAYETITGRKVYGMGGIVPDIFVPLEKDVVGQIKRGAETGVIELTYDYFDSHQTEFQQYQNLTDFMAKYSPDEGLLSKIQQNNADMMTKTYLQSEVKGLVAQLLFNDQGYHRVRNDGSQYIAEALKAVEDDSYRKKVMYK